MAADTVAGSGAGETRPNPATDGSVLVWWRLVGRPGTTVRGRPPKVLPEAATSRRGPVSGVYVGRSLPTSPGHRTRHAGGADQGWKGTGNEQDKLQTR